MLVAQAEGERAKLCLQKDILTTVEDANFGRCSLSCSTPDLLIWGIQTRRDRDLFARRLARFVGYYVFFPIIARHLQNSGNFGKRH